MNHQMATATTTVSREASMRIAVNCLMLVKIGRTKFITKTSVTSVMHNNAINMVVREGNLGTDKAIVLKFYINL